MSRDSVRNQVQNYLGTDVIQLHDLDISDHDIKSDKFKSEDDLADTERTEVVPFGKDSNIEADEIILIDTKEKV